MSSTTNRKFLKRTVTILIVIFILMNIIAALQAWSFTHFKNIKGERVNTDKLTFIQKITMLVTGASLPRPVNTTVPSQPYETITLQSNVLLNAWYIKAPRPKGTVLLFHGYQGNKSTLIEVSDAFHKMGYNTLLTDFMGSGGSEGNSTTIGAKEAEEVKTCFDYIWRKGERNIYLYGSSMGAAAVMKAVSDYSIAPGGIIIGCPFGSMYKTVSRRFDIVGIPKFPMAGLLTFWGGIENGFWAFSHNPEDYAKNIRCPALLLWGDKDNRVSRAETNTIYANLAGPKTLKTFPDAGHGQYLDVYPYEWTATVHTFLSAKPLK